MCCHNKINVGTRMWIHDGFHRCISRPVGAPEDPLAHNFIVQKVPLCDGERGGAVRRLSGATINALEAAGQLVILRDDAGPVRVRSETPRAPRKPRGLLAEA